MHDGDFYDFYNYLIVNKVKGKRVNQMVIGTVKLGCKEDGDKLFTVTPQDSFKLNSNSNPFSNIDYTI
jgi:hypothetical protein